MNAYQHCEQIAKSHYENFPVGSLLIPKKLRPHIWAIYAFARAADDFADEGYPQRNHYPNLELWRKKIQEAEPFRLNQLEDWNQKLRSCVNTSSDHPVFSALGQTIRELNLPLSLFEDLLQAFKMDVTKRRYQSWDEILHYCQYSANPVGRLVLLVFGYREEKMFEMSDAICTGLQLANFWQDIKVDLEKDRIYIPTDVLKKFYLTADSLFSLPDAFDSQFLLRELGEFTEDFFKKGKNLPFQVRGRLSWELKCTWLGGMTILKQACFNPYRLRFGRPKIKAADKLLILWNSLVSYG